MKPAVVAPGPARRLARLWRTVRWLQWEQLVGRVRFRLQRPRVDLSAPPPMRDRGATPWCRPPQREASLVAPGRLRLLGVDHALDDVGWDDAATPLLWRYNQHYFDDLNAEGAAGRREWQRQLLARWLRETRPGTGTAWAPYPCSLRIVNWIKWWLAGETPQPEAVHSLAVQARWLEQRIEWHLLGNHLFVNAKALVFAGVFFRGPEAEHWLAVGTSILLRELPEQILADGGQFERSPMYHALALEDVLDLVNLLTCHAMANTAALRSALAERVGPMLGWMRRMQHADGSFVRFNDGAEGVAPSTADIERYAAELGFSAAQDRGDGLVSLSASGYVHVRRGSAQAWLDVAPVGPDYLPGHAHADTLSFELDVGGRALIVNRGTSEYGTGPRRQAERGTGLHSTVQIGQHDSSEVWAGFRVGRRARPGPVDIQDWAVGCSHDGYRHLRGGPRHHRRWRFSAEAVRIEDRLDPPAHEPAVARYHLGPGLVLVPAGDRSWHCRTAGGDVVARIEVRHGQACAGVSLHAQRFGQLIDAATLEVTLQDQRSDLLIAWDR